MLHKNMMESYHICQTFVERRGTQDTPPHPLLPPPPPPPYPIKD